MTYCTPYLLQLGLTKSKLSLVWIAGPLSGLIMQPIVGILADKSKSKYGRRRPVMLAGAVIVGVCLLILGWTSEIVSRFVTEPEPVNHSFSTGKYRSANPRTETQGNYRHGGFVDLCPGLCYQCGSIFLSQSDCRHAAHSKAAAGFCMG